MKWKIRTRGSAADIYRPVRSHLSQFEYLSAPPVELHQHVKLSRVWQTCQHGPSIALDEMNFIIRQVAHATDCVNLGSWTVDQVFDREVLSLFEEPMEQIGKVSALLFNQHWRLIYIDSTVNPQELHWFYSYLTSDVDRTLTDAFKQAMHIYIHLSPTNIGWSGWDGVDALCAYLNKRPEIDLRRRIGTPLHETVPADWESYHTRMQHPDNGVQELALILGTQWFYCVLNGGYFKIHDNPYGL